MRQWSMRQWSKDRYTVASMKFVTVWISKIQIRYFIESRVDKEPQYSTEV